ncbi:hypothetical protein MKZ38_002631 [Zalerion maritima]|uniref:Uncharacterized protein n=1 Tax=Zalerion maritima TaxID=339359 RepID=A0AAD5RZ65_9PEZI|nr:hypothetical protein MKZ38_002631 [Zalerion maritima]
MDPATLSQGGRSRFSKALPAPPPLLDTSSFGVPLDSRSPLSTTLFSPFTVHHQQQPEVHLLPPPQKAVSPENTKPLDSPLPPLPLATPSKMSIPRKPIAGGLPASPMPANRMKQLPQHKDEEELMPPPPPPKKDGVYGKEVQEAGVESPTFSLSSLLSAYTATSTNSAVRSDSENGSRFTSTRNSDSSASPQQDEATGEGAIATPGGNQVKFPPRKESRSYRTGVSSPFNAATSPIPKDKSLPPPPPRQDSLRRPLGLNTTSSQNLSLQRETQEKELPKQPRLVYEYEYESEPEPETDAEAQQQLRPHQEQESEREWEREKKLEKRREEEKQEKRELPVSQVPAAADADAGGLHVQANPGPSLLGLNGASSSPRPELWRRRSNRTDNNLALPDLRLETTNGSTASTPNQRSAPAPVPAPATAPATAPPASSQQQQQQQTGESSGPSVQPPRSTNALPGRNIRPVAARPAPAPPVQHHQNLPTIRSPGADGQMGQNTSRIRRKSLGPRNAVIPTSTSTSASTQPNASSPNKVIHPNVGMAARPPTPEYQNNDVRSPMVETVMSPASPASSPEPAQLQEMPNQSIRRRPVGSRTSPTAPASPIRPTKSPPTFTLLPASSMPALAPSIPEHAADSAQDGSEDASTRDFNTETPQRPVSQLRKAPAGPALTPHMAVVMAAVHGAPMPELPIPVTQSSTMDGKAQAPEHAHRPNSHVYTGIPVMPGTVVDSTPITAVHYQCFKQHKHFRQSPNTNCPLTCQTCQKRDTEMRWRCNWCALRVCRNCLDMLLGSNRDLSLVMEKIAPIKNQISVLEGQNKFGGNATMGGSMMAHSNEQTTFADPISVR